ncbi:hypothetical protein ACLB2K_076413 [Fragaria x ananassa]
MNHSVVIEKNVSNVNIMRRSEELPLLGMRQPLSSSTRAFRNGRPQVQGGVGAVAGVALASTALLASTIKKSMSFDHNTSSQKLTTTNDALTFCKEVKNTFRDERKKYELFLDVMRNYKAQRVDRRNVIAVVDDLFKGHPKLISGFNTFLQRVIRKLLRLLWIPKRRFRSKLQSVLAFNLATERSPRNYPDLIKWYPPPREPIRRTRKFNGEIVGEIAGWGRARNLGSVSVPVTKSAALKDGLQSAKRFNYLRFRWKEMRP